MTDTAVVSLTDGATITIDASFRGHVDRYGAEAAYCGVTLGGNRIMAAPLNPQDGGRILLRVTQDSTGSRTLTWNSVFAFGIAYSLAQPALSTAPGTTDELEFVYDGRVGAWRHTGFKRNA